jgi:hypothetical protein
MRRSDRKHVRREDALERQKHRNGLTASEQLTRLDRRLGKNEGAKKERARLMAKL